MLHRHLMISDDGRVAKAILLERKKYEINDCLMSEMKSDAEELNVNLDALHEMKAKKSEMKKKESVIIWNYISDDNRSKS